MQHRKNPCIYYIICLQKHSTLMAQRTLVLIKGFLSNRTVREVVRQNKCTRNFYNKNKSIIKFAKLELLN